jgi:enoyl-CoA hydratase/carnithine racemase
MRVGIELTECLEQLGDDPETRVIILTGTADSFCNSLDVASFAEVGWQRIWTLEQELLNRMMELNTLVIAVLNGPVAIHSDVPLLADIVLACPEAEISDRYHFAKNVVPGDGVQLVWRSLFGTSRAGYHLLTGAVITAQQAHALGAVHELHARDELGTRARVLAQALAARPAALLTYTKAALRIDERRHFRGDLSHSLALQGLAVHAVGAP